MKAVQIFMHSLRQVTHNFADAVRVSALPYAVQFVIGILLLGSAIRTGQMDPAQMARAGGGLMLILSLIYLLVVLITSVWAAVAWHRFVLKGERPAGLLPPYSPDRTWAYFVRSLGIGALCIALAFPLGFVGALAAVPFWTEAGPSLIGLAVIFLITYLPLTVISYRLSTALPAVALDVPSAFGDGWRATKGESGTLVVLALISLVLFFVLSAVGDRLFSGLPVLSMLWRVLFGWFAIMVGLSILTTLYGHYVEGRQLV